MSRYATIADLKEEMGSRTSPAATYQMLTDRVGATTANDTVGQALLDAAESDINQKLAGRYAVPVDASGDATAAAWLRSATLTIATYLGWLKHPTRSGNRETVKTLFDGVMRTLEAIAAGTQQLPSEGPLAGPAEQPTTGTTAEAVGSERVFTEDALKDL